MIFEAVDTAITLLNALAVWILVGAALATAVTFAFVVAVWLLGRLIARAVVGARQALTRRCGGVEALDVPTEPGPTPEAADARVAVPAPTWAHTDKEAA